MESERFKYVLISLRGVDKIITEYSFVSINAVPKSDSWN